MAVVLLAEAMRLSGVETAARLALLPTAVGVAAYLGGLVPGLIAAAIAGLYAAITYLIPGQALHDVSSILLWQLSILGMALLVGIPREAAERERARALRAEALETQITLVRAAAADPTLEATLRSVLQAAVRLTAAEAGSLFLIDPGGAVTHSALTSGRPKARSQVLVDRVMADGLAGWVVRKREAALIADIRDDKRWLVVDYEQDDTRSVLAVPVLDGGLAVGVMTLMHSRPAHFVREHQVLLQSAGEQLALAVRNAQLFDANLRLAQRQAMINEVLRAVGGWFGADAVARSAADTIRRLTGWPVVSIAIASRDGRRWVMYAPRGASVPVDLSPQPIDQGVVGQAFATAQTQHVPNAAAAAVAGERRTTGSILAVPLRTGERVLGVLKVESDDLAAFGGEEIILAQSLAEAIALALDNTHLYQAIASERGRLQALIESTRDGILMIDIEGVVRVVNAPALRLLRLPGRAEDWLGKPWTKVLSCLRRHARGVARRCIDEARRISAGVRSSGEDEFELKPHVVHWLNLPVTTGAEPLGRLIVLRNVTEERQVEKAREDLVRTLVHDLRSPLTSICIALGLLGQRYASAYSPDQHRVLNMASEAAQRMLEMVNSILDVSRLESGALTPQHESIMLAALVQEVMQMQAPIAAEKDLRLENEVGLAVPRLWADAALLRRVLQNLIGNAVKFTPPGGCVRVAASTEYPGMMLITVSDTGPGIPVEIQGRLFQKFTTGSQAEVGSGLGLAFCQLAVKAHDGRIWVESESGRGTTFSILLPNPDDGAKRA